MTVREASHDLRQINIDLDVLKNARAIAGTNTLDEAMRRLINEKARLESRLEHVEISKASVAIEGVAKAVAEASGIGIDEMVGRRRFRNIIKARHSAFYIAWLTGHTLGPIGEYFDRDHSTVINGRDKVISDMDTDAELASIVSEAIKNLRT